MVLNLAFEVHIEPENAGHFSSAYNYVVGEIHRYLMTALILVYLRSLQALRTREQRESVIV